TVWPSGFWHVPRTLLVVLLCCALLAFLPIITHKLHLDDSGWGIGFILIMFIMFQAQATFHQARGANASITVGPSDVIVRFTGWFGNGSVHWLRDEITDISASVRDTFWRDAGVRSMLLIPLRRTYVLSVQTVPSFPMRVLDGHFLNYEEAT